MERPLYEKEALQKAVLQCDTNIQSFRDAIVVEQARREEMVEYIQAWEVYNKLNEGE